MDNPLKMALFSKKQEQPPRVFELNTKEIGGAKVGQELEICIKGKIQSIHDDGRAYLKVVSVEKEEPETEKTSEQKPMYVKTQESHVP